MLNAFLVVLLACAIITFGILSKRLNFQNGTVTLLLGVSIYIVLGRIVFFVSGVMLAFYYLICYLLYLFSKSLYAKVFENVKKDAGLMVALGGTLFAILLVLFLNKSTYDEMNYNFSFFKLVFFVSLASGFSLAFSNVINGFAKGGISLSTNSKTPPCEIGSITIIGALGAAISCFAIGFLVFTLENNVIWAIITVLLGFIGYLADALIKEKLQKRPPALNETEETPTEFESNYLSLTFVSVLLPTLIALIVGLILK